MPRDNWVSDKSVDKCKACSATFTFFVRKHHCRKCGNIFCNKCSTARVPLSSSSSTPVKKRVCQPCYIDRRRTMFAEPSDFNGGGEGDVMDQVAKIAEDVVATSPTLSAGTYPSSPESPAAPPSSPKPSPPPGARTGTLGITLAGVRAFMASCGEARFRGITTADVLSRNAIYVPVIANMYPDHSGPASVWVIHPWNGKFLRLLESLEAWEKRKNPPTPTFFYIDLFCSPLTQGPRSTASSVKEQYLTRTLPTNLASMASTLFVLDAQARALKRLWCLFEAQAASLCGALEIVMAPEEEVLLENALRSLSFEKLMEVYTKVDFFTAQSERPEEAKRMLLMLRETGEKRGEGVSRAVDRVTGVLTRFLLSKALSCSPPPESSQPSEATSSNILLTTALLMGACGEQKKALASLSKIVALRNESLGADHTDSINSALQYAKMLSETGDAPGARAVLNSSLDAATRAVAAKEESGVESAVLLYPLQISLATNLSFSSPTPHSRVLELFREALAALRQKVGDTHPESLQCACQLGVALSLASVEKKEEEEDGRDILSLTSQAGETLMGALSTAIKTLGSAHSVSICLGNEYGDHLIRSGDWDAGESFWAETVRDRRKTLGDAHWATAYGLLGVGRARACLGDVEGAERHIREAGSVDPTLAKKFCCDLAKLLDDRGSEEDSIKIKAIALSSNW